MIQIYNYTDDVTVTLEGDCDETVKACNGMILNRTTAPPYSFKVHFQNYAMECLLNYRLSQYQITPLILTKDKEGIKNIRIKENELIMRYVENRTLFIFEGIIERDGDDYE